MEDTITDKEIIARLETALPIIKDISKAEKEHNAINAYRLAMSIHNKTPISGELLENRLMAAAPAWLLLSTMKTDKPKLHIVKAMKDIDEINKEKK